MIKERVGEKEGLESSPLSELTSSLKNVPVPISSLPLLLSLPLFQFNFKTILKKIVGDSSKRSVHVILPFLSTAFADRGVG